MPATLPPSVCVFCFLLYSQVSEEKWILPGAVNVHVVGVGPICCFLVCQGIVVAVGFGRCFCLLSCGVGVACCGGAVVVLGVPAPRLSPHDGPPFGGASWVLCLFASIMYGCREWPCAICVVLNPCVRKVRECVLIWEGSEAPGVQAVQVFFFSPTRHAVGVGRDRVGDVHTYF